MTRPSDFFLSILDLFAVIIPGAVLTALLWPTLEPAISEQLTAVGSWTTTAAFLVIAFVGGQLAYAAGSILDRPYDRWRTRSIGDDPFLRLAKEFAAEAGGRADGVNMYQWAEAHLRLWNPAAIAEIDRQQAHSKLFRSLSVVLVFAAVTGFVNSRDSILLGAVALLPPVVWRFFKLRLRATQDLYLYYVISGRNVDSGTKQTGG